MRRVLFDSNAIDPIADQPGAYETLRAAVDSGELEILYTHVTIDELAKIPDLERRQRLLLLMVGLGRLVPTAAMILGYSRLDLCRLPDERTVEITEILRSRGVNHSPDALIAGTALYEEAALVTNEHRLTRRALECDIEVLTTAKLVALHPAPPHS